MRQNFREFDFLRAFVAFSVIAIHILSRRFYVSRFAYVLDMCLVYAVPLFLFVIGLTSVLAYIFSMTPVAEIIGVAKVRPKNKVEEININA